MDDDRLNGQRDRNVGRQAKLRARWAALGAAVAISLGGGGWYVATAGSSEASQFVAIDPVRILDSRSSELVPGLDAGATTCLDVTTEATRCGGGGTVPEGATAVVVNVTAVEPDAAGFVAVEPGRDITQDDFDRVPETSTVNFAAGETEANLAIVRLPTDGEFVGTLTLGYHTYGPPGFFPDDDFSQPIVFFDTHVLLDVTGYYVGAAP